MALGKKVELLLRSNEVWKNLRKQFVSSENWVEIWLFQSDLYIEVLPQCNPIDTVFSQIARKATFQTYKFSILNSQKSIKKSEISEQKGGPEPNTHQPWCLFKRI